MYGLLFMVLCNLGILIVMSLVICNVELVKSEQLVPECSHSMSSIEFG